MAFDRFFHDMICVILVIYHALGIQSPSENGNGTWTLCWGGDLTINTPIIESENMTIDA